MHLFDEVPYCATEHCVKNVLITIIGKVRAITICCTTACRHRHITSPRSEAAPLGIGKLNKLSVQASRPCNL